MSRDPVTNHARLLRSITAQLPRFDAQIKACNDEVELTRLLLRRHDLVELRDGVRRALARETAMAAVELPGLEGAR